ncbi:MAG: alpha/beta hydrolase [Microthrixaceae bacterium]
MNEAQPTATITSSDGLALALWHLGGDGPPLLLGHATGFAGGIWQPVVDRLSSDAACWAVDFRGHGHSPADPDDMVWTRVADDVLATARFLSERHGGPVAAAGHSMGGGAVLAAGARHPELFTALWAYEPVIFPPVEAMGLPAGTQLPDPESNPLALGARRRRAHFADREAARANFANKPPLNVFCDAAMEAYLTWCFAPTADGITLRCRPDVEARTYVEGSRHSFWDEVATLSRQATVVSGRPEGFSPSHFAEQVAGHIPGGAFEQHPDLGHFGPQQAPEAIARSIASALL